MNRRTVTLGSLALLTGLLACSDRNRAPVDITGPETTRAFGPPGVCSLNSLAKDARDFFSNPEQQDATALVGIMEDHCEAAAQAPLTEASWTLMELVQFAVEQGVGGSTSVGSDIVNKLFDCIEGLCASQQDRADFSEALGFAGMFDIVNGAAERVTQRDFIDLNPDSPDEDIAAVWFAQPTGGVTTWSDVIFGGGAQRAVVFGAPNDDLPIEEFGIGGAGYDFNVYPDPNTGPTGGFEAPGVTVEVCFYPASPAFPGTDPDGEDLRPRAQREAVLLSKDAIGDCPDDPRPTEFNVASAMEFLADLLGPTPLFAQLDDDELRCNDGDDDVSELEVGECEIPRIGGSASDFSRVRPVAALTAGQILEVMGPPRNVTADDPFTVRYQAVTNNGTPVELVEITLDIRNNEGEPAGAVLSGDVTKLTLEPDGISTHSISVGKAGAYIVCATGSIGGDEGFAFSEVCSRRFNAKNAKNGGE